MGDIHLSLNYEKLEGNEEKKRTELKIRINGEVLFTDGIDILGFYQWPTDPAFSKSLACFIQPSHPLVNNITLDAHTCLKGVDNVMSFTRLLKTDREDRVDLVLKAIYDCLVAKYQIQYLPPPQSLEADYQVVRPPHRVINDSRQRRGGGTCIDMALLFASCLENLQLQPLIIFIKEEGSIQHAFVGCWRLITERFEPVLRDPEKIKKALRRDPRQKLIVVETTGVTDRFQETLGFEEAVKKAEEQIQTKEFLFALDVSAIRQTVVPLQFPMSPKAITIVRKAEELARSEKNKRLETKHLVHSLLLNREGINRVLEQAKVDTEKIKPALLSSTSVFETIDEVLPSPTINYRRVIEDARLTASDTGLTYVDEQRLWYAVLLSQSESVDRILEDIGTTRKNLKSIFDHHYAWTGDVVQTFYEL